MDNPTLLYLLRYSVGASMIDSQKYSLMLPARIVEFFPVTQTATILICAETIFSSSEDTSDIKLREPLEGVPVHVVGGGGWHLTMPIKAGDPCIISFSQVGYDHWLYEDKDEAGLLAGLPKPHLLRKFHEDDGFVTVGFNTLPRAIKKYSATDSTWINDNVDHEAGEDFQVIALKEDLSIVIDSSVSLTINAPAVVVNCTTAEVNAEESSVVNCDTSKINAGTSAIVKSPIATMDCDVGTIKASGTVELDAPITNVSGILNVSGAANITGAVTGAGGLAVSGGSGASVTGNLATSGGDVTADGKSLKTHTHTISSGSSAGETQPPS